MHILYYSPGACSLAPHIILEEIGDPYELRRVDLTAGQQRTDEYRALNPKGRVPALVMPDQSILTEANAIMLLLARSHPEAALIPVQPTDEARMFEWMNWLATVHAATVATILRPERFLDDEGLYPALKEKGLNTLRENYSLIDERVKGKKFSAGDRYSLSDAYLIVFYSWGYRIGLAMNEYPDWCAMMEEIAKRPAIQRALGQEGITLSS